MGIPAVLRGHWFYPSTWPGSQENTCAGWSRIMFSNITLEMAGSVRAPQERGGNRKKYFSLEARRAARHFLCWADTKSITHPWSCQIRSALTPSPSMKARTRAPAVSSSFDIISSYPLLPQQQHFSYCITDWKGLGGRQICNRSWLCLCDLPLISLMALL